MCQMIETFPFSPKRKASGPEAAETPVETTPGTKKARLVISGDDKEKTAALVEACPTKDDGLARGAELVTWGTGDMGQLGQGPDVDEVRVVTRRAVVKVRIHRTIFFFFV